MNVTIVKEDRVVMVDGDGLNFDFALDDNIWAIQWNGSTGEVEYNDGAPNLTLDSFSDYQYLVDAHSTEKQRVSDEEAQAQADITYVEKRVGSYPSLEEQADMQYWDAINGTTTWIESITAVKEKHPK